MNCEEVQELLIDYLEGELPRRQSGMIQGHLGECETCAAQAQEYESVLDTLADSMDDPGDAYFANLFPRIKQRIDNLEGLPWYRRIFSKMSGWQKGMLAGAPAAVALVVAVALFMPGLFGAGNIGPGKVYSPMEPMAIRTSVLPNTGTAVSLEDMTETEVEELHNALMVALESVMSDQGAEGYTMTSAIPGGGMVMPAGLDDLDPDDIGTVMDELSDMPENTI